MSKPTRRKTKDSKPRARSDSARFIAHRQNSESQPKRKSAKKATTQKIANQPYLWTKEKPKSKQKSSEVNIFDKSKSAFSTIGRSIGFFFGRIFAFITKNRTARIAAIALSLFLLIGAVDFGINWGKVYPGIKVGEVDLGGKTAEEAAKLLEDTYGPRLVNKQVYIFADEEASENSEESIAQINNESYAEQHSLEEAQAHKRAWQTDAGSLGATLDTKEIVQQALALGRADGGVFTRIGALLNGWTIEPWAHYDNDAVEELAQNIDLTIGNPRVNYNVTIIDGQAIVTDGHDGTMIDREAFTKEIDKALLMTDEQQASFVAHAEHAALQIDEEMANETCDIINEAIQHGVRFVYHDASWDVETTELGSWIQTNIVEKDGEDSWELQPYVSYDLAKTSLSNHLRASFNESEVKISFTNENGNIQVHTQSSGTMPKTQEAIDALNAELFGDEGIPDGQVVIEAESTAIPHTLSLEEALDTGVVEKVSEFTTEYTANVENRNHNIHLVADLLNNSIAEAEGGIWSFNDTAGNCNEEAGFKGAGSIINGEYVDEIGGGICQVATTVFNAVYNSGLPVIQRHNHSLYIASYPAGRDAAVSWPDLDLRWENDTSSDILLQTHYTDTSVTVVLYGISPDYQVSTETGNWEEGEKYEKRTVTDETLKTGESYIKTYGSDGSKITVVRTVKDRDGNILYQDTFSSVYEPKDEITVEGPKKEGESSTAEASTS